MNITEICAAHPTIPGNGKVEGPDDGEGLYMGFRALNAEGSKHPPFGKDDRVHGIPVLFYPPS